jgi:hypothetical protein
MKLLSVVVALLLLTGGSTGQNCAIWNTGAPGGNTLHGVLCSGPCFHQTGDHWGDFFRTGYCRYSKAKGV